ncbi:Protein uxt [Clonorchis sinensis]|uniref:Protein uxt n=1 Tax=Clonorchis sinensis TaxID=79923 RepID=A0A8T1MR89_CLOSI|nr:Protein uxt [Clonorchis sinensis]
MPKSLSDRVARLEHHVNEVLREDLRKTLEAGDEIYAEISEYLQLRNLLEKIRDFQLPTANVKTMVDIGCNVYVKGVIPTSERIFVDIGLGFHLECDHMEALSIIDLRVNHLNERSTVFKKKSNAIKAQIKLFLEALREIQGIPANSAPSPVSL